jgi:hypothetical protein
VPLAEAMNPVKPSNSFCPLEAGGRAESSGKECDVVRRRRGKRRSVVFILYGKERFPTLFQVSVSGSTMTRDEAVAQDGAEIA